MHSVIKYIVLLALLAAPLPAFAWTISTHTCAAQVGGGDGSDLTSSSIDTSGTTLLLLYSSVYIGSGTVSVSDSKSNTWNGLTNVADSRNSRLFYAYNATVGSGHTFTISASGASLFNGAFCIMSVSGSLSGSDPFDVQNTNFNSDAGTLTTGSITPSQNSELIVSGFGSAANNSAPTIDTGFTIIDSSTGAGHDLVALAYLVQGTASSVNPTWTVDPPASNQAGIASFKGPATARRPIGAVLFR